MSLFSVAFMFYIFDCFNAPLFHNFKHFKFIQYVNPHIPSTACDQKIKSKGKQNLEKRSKISPNHSHHYCRFEVLLSQIQEAYQKRTKICILFA